MPAGRPSKYTPALLMKAYTYLSVYKQNDEVVPTIAGLAVFLGITKQTCFVWRDEPDKQQFSDLLDNLMDVQERELASGGLQGRYNGSITKMMMTKHVRDARLMLPRSLPVNPH